MRASVSIEIQSRFHVRKGGTTQNVLGVVTFYHKFTHVLVVWERSAHDSKVLGNALKMGFNVPRGNTYVLSKLV